MGLCGKDHRDNVSFYHVILRTHIISMSYYYGIYLDHLAEVMFARFLHWKVFFYPVSILQYHFYPQIL